MKARKGSLRGALVGGGSHKKPEEGQGKKAHPDPNLGSREFIGEGHGFKRQLVKTLVTQISGRKGRTKSRILRQHQEEKIKLVRKTFLG